MWLLTIVRQILPSGRDGSRVGRGDSVGRGDRGCACLRACAFGGFVAVVVVVLCVCVFVFVLCVYMTWEGKRGNS